MTTVLYTAQAKASGGRNGRAETTDGTLKFDLASPGAPNAKPGTTNPEQLFACGYAACFGGALELAAKQNNVPVSNVAIHSSVSLLKGDDGFSLAVILDAQLPGIAQDQAAMLLQAAHQICPYSKATRGNISVTLKANGVEAQKKAA